MKLMSPVKFYKFSYWVNTISIFISAMNLIFGFYYRDYYQLGTGAFFFLFTFSLFILCDLYAHCHGLKVWKTDSIKEDENE